MTFMVDLVANPFHTYAGFGTMVHSKLVFWVQLVFWVAGFLYLGSPTGVGEWCVKRIIGHTNRFQ